MIKVYTDSNVKRVEGSEPITTMGSRSGGVETRFETRTVFYEILEASNQLTRVEVGYKLVGRYTYDTAALVIVNVFNPVFEWTVPGFELNGYENTDVYYISRNSYKYTNGSNATFEMDWDFRPVAMVDTVPTQLYFGPYSKTWHVYGDSDDE